MSGPLIGAVILLGTAGMLWFDAHRHRELEARARARRRHPTQPSHVRILPPEELDQ